MDAVDALIGDNVSWAVQYHRQTQLRRVYISTWLSVRAFQMTEYSLSRGRYFQNG